MKAKSILYIVVLVFLGQILISAQVKDFIVAKLLRNIKTAELIIEAKVVDIVKNHDEHNSLIVNVTFEIKSILSGKFETNKVVLKYFPNRLTDQDILTYKFIPEYNYILLLKGNGETGFSLLGGDLGKFLVVEDNINVLNIRKEEFGFVLNRIRNNIQTDFDVGMLNDLAGEMMGPIKLNGEFAIINPDFHNKPKGQTITFRINPAGAKDKNGNQLTFNQIYNVINNVISAWNSVSCSYTVFSLLSTPYSGSRVSGDGISTITFETWNLLPNGSGDTPSLSSEINEYDIIFNSLLRWNTESTYPSSYPTYSAPTYDPYSTFPIIGPVDLQDVATHEFGHAVGLANLSESSIYDYTMRTTNYDVNYWWERTSRRNLSTGDKAGKIYMDPDFSSTITQPVPKMLLANPYSVTFNGSLTVPSGYYLEIESAQSLYYITGKELLFSNGSSLIINGTLNAVGGGSWPLEVMFDRISSGTWGGIVFNSNSSNCIMQYCRVKNAGTGITCISSLPNINNSFIVNNTTGISIYSIGTPVTELSNNYIGENTNRGIYLSGASPKIYSNTITNNAYHGIYCYNSSRPYLYGNTITDHSGSGLNCTSYSSAYLVPWNAYGYYWGSGNNVIRNNTGRGIDASYWSNLYLGSSPYGGYNSIYNNTGYEMSAMYNCNIMAEINWWGAYPPNSSEFYTYQSTIDYTPALSSNPNSAMQSSVASMEASASGFNKAVREDPILENAYSLQLEGKFDEAIAAYSNFVNTKPSDPRAAYALVRLEECYSLSNRDGFLNYLNKDVKSLAVNNKELAVVSLELESQYLIREEKYKEAIANFQIIKKDYNINSYTDKFSIFNTGYIYLKSLNDVDNAVKSFEELAAKYPNDELVEESKYLMNGVIPNMPKNSTLNAAILPSEFELAQNYPNPFNPSTTISYNLPRISDVELKIYDLLGNEINSFFISSQPSGTHSMIWDGTNNFNVPVASGIYLYIFRAISVEGKREVFEKSSKMIYLK